MSETTFPFEGQGSEPPIDSGAGSSRRKVAALGGLAGATVLGLAAYFLVFAGGGGEDELAYQVKRPAAGSVATPAPAAKPKPVTQPKISAASFGRNPFKALVVDAPPAPAAPAPGTATGSGTTPPTGSTNGGTIGGTITGGTTSTPTQSQPHVFQVVSVAPDNSTITVKVDGATYKNQRAGKVFATYFKVLIIGGGVNSFQFGDVKFTVAGTRPISIAN